MGHYKVALECIRHENYVLSELVVSIAHLSLISATLLSRWHKASQVMIKKGKGRFVKNLHIIQLCEADLNFTLHTIWGHRLIRQALRYSALDSAQFALPGQTFNNAILNKILFFNLSRQTLSPGILMDYDATVAFDRVLANLSIITSQRMGLPHTAGYFMFYLLQCMSFNLITGFGKSASSYNNDSDGVVGHFSDLYV
jgi:hypothetical protein